MLLPPSLIECRCSPLGEAANGLLSDRPLNLPRWADRRRDADAVRAGLIAGAFSCSLALVERRGQATARRFARNSLDPVGHLIPQPNANRVTDWPITKILSRILRGEIRIKRLLSRTWRYEMCWRSI